MKTFAAIFLVKHLATAVNALNTSGITSLAAEISSSGIELQQQHSTILHVVDLFIK
jgi:precorrin-2 methylase